MLPRLERFAVLRLAFGQLAHRGVEDEGAAGGFAVLGIDVRRELLEVHHQPRVKRIEGVEVRPERGSGLERVFVRGAAGVDVAIDVLDEDGVERELPLQVRSNGPPDHPDEPALEAPRRGRRRQDVPGVIQLCEMRVVERRVRRGDVRAPGQSLVDRRKRIVVAAVRVVALVLETPECRLQRLVHVVPMRPCTGLLGDAYSRRGMRAARYAIRPDSTASFIAAAMATGSCARAMAVFISTPSAPSSIAIAASDAVPTPASTITGTRACALMMRMLFGFWMPSPEPIGAPSGMTAAAPASSSLRQITGSSLVYGSTTKPSRTRMRVASSSATLSGNSVRSSPMTSSLTQFDSPTSRPSLAVRTASSAV